MLTSSQRRGLKMAARLTCVVALGGAIAQVATANAAETAPSAPSATENTKMVQGESHPVADALRLSPQSGGCVPSWGPLAPPACDPALSALFAREGAA